jgi:excisionase family DNA binding protein
MKSNYMPGTFATKKELAAYYNVSTRTVTNWMRQRRISFQKIGRLTRFHWETVCAEIEERGLIRCK